MYSIQYSIKSKLFFYTKIGRFYEQQKLTKPHWRLTSTTTTFVSTTRKNGSSVKWSAVSLKSLSNAWKSWHFTPCVNTFTSWLARWQNSTTPVTVLRRIRRQVLSRVSIWTESLCWKQWVVFLRLVSIS